MTPSLRNLWLSELWQTVPEWHQTKDEAADARERNALLNRPSTAVDELSTDCADKGAHESAEGAA